MRKKGEILTASREAIAKVPKEGQEMLEHEYLMLEVFIDLRDVLQGVFNRLADIAEALQDKH